MAAAEGVSTGKGDDFLVIESVRSEVRCLKGFGKSISHTPYGRRSGGKGVSMLRERV